MGLESKQRRKREKVIAREKGYGREGVRNEVGESAAGKEESERL